MSEPCPDPSLLRALGEAEGLEGLVPDPERVRAHVRGCADCQKRLTLLGREEEALRGLATKVTPDARALAATLAAVRREAASPSQASRPSAESGPPAQARGSTAESGPPAQARGPSAEGRGPSRESGPSRRQRGTRQTRPRAPWGAVGIAIGMGVVALALARVNPPGEAPVPAASPSPEVRPSPSPRAPSPSPTARETPAPDETPDPASIAVAPRATPSPDASPDTPEVRPSPEAGLALVPSPAPSAATTVRTLARAGSAGLAVKGRELAPGEALPEGATVEARTTGALVEGEGATLLLAARTSVAVERGTSGPTFVVGSGRALVTTKGEGAVGTADVLCTTASETAFVIAVDGASATVTALEGSVRLDARRPQATDVSTVVPAGFAVAANRGKVRAAPEPVDGGRALDWVPRSRRPAKAPPVRRVLRVLDAEADRRLVTDGLFLPADASSARPYVRGVAGSFDQNVVRFSDKSPSLARVGPDVLVEVTVRVSRPARLSVMVFDDTANENFEWTSDLPANRWVTIVSPLSAFANKAKAPRPIQKDDVVHALFVGAGPASEGVELLVQGARFIGERSGGERSGGERSGGER